MYNSIKVYIIYRIIMENIDTLINKFDNLELIEKKPIVIEDSSVLSGEQSDKDNTLLSGEQSDKDNTNNFNKSKSQYIIKKFINNYINKLKNLKSIKYNKYIIEYRSIFLFEKTSKRDKNDISNKIRELVICNIINNNIPEQYFIYSRLWKIFKNKLLLSINKIFDIISINKSNSELINLSFENFICKIHAGKKNYDFLITYTNNNKEISKKVEFKFNSDKIDNCPQFLSLSNKFNIEKSSDNEKVKYTEIFYDIYLEKITSLYNIETTITKNNYFKYVYQQNFHKNIFFKNLYEKESDFNNKKNEDNNKKNEKKIIVDESIDYYIKNYVDKIDINKLTHKFLQSQEDKIYLLYDIKKHNFYIDKINDEELKLLDKYIFKKNKDGLINTIIYETISKTTTIHMLLRWRNHSGILNPAWQISLKR